MRFQFQCPQVNFYWFWTISTQLQIWLLSSDCFHITLAKHVSRWDRDHIICKAQTVYSLAFYGKNLLSFVVEEIYMEISQFLSSILHIHICLLYVYTCTHTYSWENKDRKKEVALLTWGWTIACTWCYRNTSLQWKNNFQIFLAAEFLYQKKFPVIAPNL